MLALDLRRSFHVIRRYGILVGIAVAVSLLAGIATAAVSPAAVTSTALVVLPVAGQNAVAAAGGEPAPFTATQEVIAGSYPVLASALPDVRPAMSLSGLRHDIQIGSPAPYVMSVSARGDTAGDAEATANAVARSYLQYVGSASSPAGRVQAHYSGGHQRGRDGAAPAAAARRRGARRGIRRADRGHRGGREQTADLMMIRPGYLDGRWTRA